jgi:hypothetical protein
MAAHWATANPGIVRTRVEGIAADAMKRRFPSINLEALVIAVIVAEPKHEKNNPDQGAIDDGRRSDIKHASSVRPTQARPGKRPRGFYALGSSAVGAASATAASAAVAWGLGVAAFFLPAALRPRDFL